MSKADDILRKRGSAFDPSEDPTRKTQKCTVVDVHPDSYTVDVLTDHGKYIGSIPWPSIYRDPNGMGGDISVPKRGQSFELYYSRDGARLGLVVPTNYAGLEPPAENRIFEAGEDVGGADGVYDGAKKNYRGGMPPDVLPGDWAHVGASGNLVAVLEGGVSVLKGSEAAKIIANSTGDQLQLVGRNTSLATDWGEINFINDGGKVNMSVRAGAQQLTESSPGEENWTIWADLGNTGELVNFRVTDQKGATKAGLRWRPDGTVERTAASDMSESVGGTITVASQKYDIDVKATYVVRIGTDETRDVKGASTTRTGGNLKFTAGNDAVFFGNRDTTLSAGRFLQVSVGGSITNGPGDAAYTTTVTNGSWVVDIGNPTAGDIIAAMSGFTMNTFMGDIVFNTKLGNIKLKTVVPESVQLGGQFPIFHAMLFEMFEAYMGIFGALIDTHIHATGVGPSTPPLVPPYASSVGAITPIMSNYVLLGG